jgi:hypothetical protein
MSSKKKVAGNLKQGNMFAFFTKKTKDYNAHACHLEETYR